MPRLVLTRGMTQYRDPSWLIERAWSSFSLVTLQQVIEGTISSLEQLEPEPTKAAADMLDAKAEALKACIEELRHASGSPNAEVRRATHCELVANYIAQQPASWGEEFGIALERYRRAASSALQTSLGTHSAV